ncbi:MAG: MFS transporter [Pseudomonadota bacterium]|nr:MFS transporter [Pseudomonadota bacterium]
MAKGFFYGYYLIAVVFVVFGLTNFWPIAFGGFRDSLMGDIGISATEFGALFSAHSLMVAGSYAVGGLLAARGVRLVLLLALGFYALGLLVLSQADSLLLLMLGFGFLLPTAISFGEVGGYALIVNWFHRDRGSALGISALGGSLSGYMAIPIVWMIAEFDWRSTLLVFAIGVPVVLLPMVWRVVDRPEQRGEFPDGGAALPEGESDEEHPTEEPDEWPLRRIALDRRFLIMSLISGTGLACVTSIVGILIPHATGLGVSAELAATAVGTMAALAGLTRIAIGWLADRHDARWIFALVLGLEVAGMALLFVADGFWPFAIGAVLFGSYAGLLPPQSILLADWFGSKGYPRALGAAFVVGFPFQLTLPVLAGWIYGETGSYHAYFPVTMSLVACAVLLLVTLPANTRPRHKQA